MKRLGNPTVRKADGDRPVTRYVFPTGLACFKGSALSLLLIIFPYLIAARHGIQLPGQLPAALLGVIDLRKASLGPLRGIRSPGPRTGAHPGES